MALQNYRPASSVRPEGISCPKWTPVAAASKRCAHYLSNGSCALPDEVMCLEWLKRNPAPPPEALLSIRRDKASHATRTSSASPSLPRPDDPRADAAPADLRQAPPGAQGSLLGAPSPPPPPPLRKDPPPGHTRLPGALQGYAGSLPLPSALAPHEGLLDPKAVADVEELVRGGREITIAADPIVGDVVLVPAYTDRQDRQELTFRDAALVRALVGIFPGAEVIRIQPPAPSTEGETK